MANTAVETNLAAQLHLRLCGFSLQRVHNNPYEPIRMLIVDEEVKLIVSKQNQLMLKIVLALNVRFRLRPAFL